MVPSNTPREHQAIVHPDRLRQFVQLLFQRCGLSEDDAYLVADSLVVADMRGHPSHGVQRTSAYITRLRAGSINPRAQGVIIRETDGSAHIDGENGMGQVISHRAMRLAIEKARNRGIAAVQVKNSNHFGTCAYFAMMALPEDMIGFAATNATLIMPPYGGKAPRIGNNPWAFAVPANEEPPIVLDMAQAVAAVGKVQIAQRLGQKIPLTWATDRYGNPTDDPGAVLDGGMYLPIGAYKGFGQAMIVDVLCGLLGGRAWADIRGLFREPDKPSHLGHFFFAIDIASFTDVETFKTLVDNMIRGIRNTPLAEGFERIYSPGEPEAEAQARHKHGVPVLKDVIVELNQLAAELSVSERL